MCHDLDLKGLVVPHSLLSGAGTGSTNKRTLILMCIYIYISIDLCSCFLASIGCKVAPLKLHTQNSSGFATVWKNRRHHLSVKPSRNSVQRHPGRSVRWIASCGHPGVPGAAVVVEIPCDALHYNFQRGYDGRVGTYHSDTCALIVYEE